MSRGNVWRDKFFYSWIKDYLLKSHISELNIDKAIEDLKSEMPCFIFGTHAAICFGETIQKAKRAQSLLIEQGHGSILIFTSSSIPMNNETFPRGFIVGGTKFPILPDSKVNQIVSIAPAARLKFPKYRVLALKSGIDRRLFKAYFLELTQVINNLNFSTYAQQITATNYHLWNDYFLERPLSLLTVPLENLIRDALLWEGLIDLECYIKESDLANGFWRIRDGYKRGELKTVGGNIEGDGYVRESKYRNILADLKEEIVYPKFNLCRMIIKDFCPGLVNFDEINYTDNSEVRDALALQKKFLLS